eukprot:g11431.t1
MAPAAFNGGRSSGAAVLRCSRMAPVSTFSPLARAVRVGHHVVPPLLQHPTPSRGGPSPSPGGVKQKHEVECLQRRSFSTGSGDEVILTPPGSVPATSSSLYTVTLNRPKKLNSLSLTMIELLREIYGNKIPAAAAAQSVTGGAVVWLEGAGDKAFCAGGDVAALAAALQKGDRTAGGEFFNKEYSVDFMIAEKNRDHIVSVSVWDKIVMGGGVGLGFHNPIRLVTQKTMFAMPETKIGLFPDVGMTWGLSRLPNADPLAVARFLGLSGFRLNAADCIAFGVGTHFVKQEDLPAVKQHLSTISGEVTPATVAAHLAASPAVLGPSASLPLEPGLSAADCDTISRCFGASVSSVAEVLERLAGERENVSFARKVAETLGEMSPLSLRVSWEAIEAHRAVGVTLREALKMEYRMAMHCLRPQPEADFAEGVTALLLEKRKAKWAHGGVQDVAEDLVQSYFAPVDGVAELGPWAKDLDI